MSNNIVNGKEQCKKAIESIGQDLIRRAEDIAYDLEHVTSIEIKAKLNPFEIVNYDVNKNYSVFWEDKEGN